ncbi:MAG: transcription-repair coupling factor, partial [Gammaproteobacteria bacterium]
MTHSNPLLIGELPSPTTGETVRWPPLGGAALALALAEQAACAPGPIVALAPDVHTADSLAAALDFFAADATPVIAVPEREMLPYDTVSPARAIVSERLRALANLPTLARGIVLATADLSLERLPPRDWLVGASFDHAVGQRLDLEAFRAELVAAGYAAVGEVREPGEFALRGGLIDVFPTGADAPVRLELSDDEIESLRHFDADTQLSGGKVERIRLLPAYEFPFNDDSIRGFRGAWRARLAGDPMASDVYRAISEGRIPAGIESWLPLFFETTAGLADYLPSGATLATLPGFDDALDNAYRGIESRYEALRHDIARPLLPSDEAFFTPGNVRDSLGGRSRIQVEAPPAASSGAEKKPEKVNAAIDVETLPDLSLDARAGEPLERLLAFAGETPSLLLAAESPGRRETVRELLARRGLEPVLIDDWRTFRERRPALALAVAELVDGFFLPKAGLAVVPDAAVFGTRA